MRGNPSKFSAIALLPAALAVAALALTTTAYAASFTVNSSADAVDSLPGDGICETYFHVCTLRAAILEANAQTGVDTIVLPAGRYELRIAGTNEDDSWKGDLDITADVVIEGADEHGTVIDGRRMDRVLDVHSPAQVSLSKLTVTNGEPPAAQPVRQLDERSDGGGIRSDGTLTLSEVTITRNHAGKGPGTAGGLKSLGDATLDHVTFSLNQSGRAYALSNAPWVNFAGDIGGMWSAGTATLSNVSFIRNRAGDGVEDGFGGESTNGGNIGAFYNEGTATLTDVEFNGNRAGDGFPLGDYRDGTAGGSAGAVLNEGTLTLQRVRFVHNRAGDGASGGYGGGMYNDADVTMSDVEFVSNRAGRSGSEGGTAGDGGGLENFGFATISQALFDRNRAGDGRAGDGGWGGGISNEAIITLENVTITRNRAGNGKGAFALAGYGGGVYGFDETNINNATIAYNRAGRKSYRGTQADKGYGNQVYGGIRLSNTILVGREPNCDAAELPTSNGHNLDSGHSCDLTANGDVMDADARLGRLQANGGFTASMALQPGSAALDAGDPSTCAASDQRGVTRPQGAACDIGAYELEP